MSLTLLYYTANRVNDSFAEKVRERLLRSSDTLPIISVSQKPIDFGQNICLGELGFSPYHLYRQVLEGAKAARTTFVAFCEDDTLYPLQHFLTLPPTEDAFYYNTQRWWLESSGVFRHRTRTSGCACIAPRALLIDTLEKRFEKYPEPPPGRWAWRHFGEPGRIERKIGLDPVKLTRYQTQHAVVTVNHRDSLGGKRRMDREHDTFADELPIWGSAAELWEELYD
jgi:hypothetical protein